MPTPPYALAWDTRTVSNGAHTLTARARDAAGNSTLSAPVPVNVANTSSFQNEILATGFNLPTSIEFLPDGRMLVAELPGTIKVLPPPYTSAEPDALPAADQRRQRRLRRAAAGHLRRSPSTRTSRPTTTTTSSTRSSTPNRDRLSRFTANASLTGDGPGQRGRPLPGSAGRRQPSITAARSTSATTASSTSRPASTSDARRRRSLTSPRGKIHRINPDGTVPTDNPFYDGAGPNVDSIWALGLRNPFRAYYDAPTGRLYIGDVGGNDYATAKEEVNLGAAGANYGWPNCEGPCASPCTSPLYSYPHNGRDAAITGGFVYHGTQFPSGYQGSYFFADYTQNWIKRLTFDAERERQRRLQLRAAGRLRRRPLRRHRLPHGRAGRRALLRRPRLLGHQRHLRRQQDPPDPLPESQPAADRGRGSESDRRAGAAHRHLLERGLVGSRRPAAHLFVDVRRRRHVDRGEPDATPTRSRVSTRRGSRSRTASTRRSRRRSRSASAAPPTATILVAAGRQSLPRG